MPMKVTNLSLFVFYNKDLPQLLPLMVAVPDMLKVLKTYEVPGG